MSQSAVPSTVEWQQTACILCSLNCGIEVQVDDRRIARIRGDQAHPALAGLRVREGAAARPLPERPRPADGARCAARADGTLEEVDWDTAIAEVAARLARVRDEHGGESIFYYGGGGQGNHLGGAYGGGDARGVRRPLHVERARAGEDRRVLGRRPAVRPRRAATRAPTSSTPRSRSSSARTRGMSHGFPRARVVAEGDRQRPGPRADRDRPAPHGDRGAGRLPPAGAAGRRRVPARRAARVLVQEDLLDHAFLAEHATRRRAVARRARATSPSPSTARRAGVDEELVRAAARRIAAAAQRRRSSRTSASSRRRTRR